MKSNISSVCAAALLAASLSLNAGDAATTKTASPEFERIKTLVGTWKGTADIGQGPMEMTVEYRLIAAGSVLEERVFPGSPNEMVTMYFDKGGKLALTHYCMMGNRPAMLLKSSDTKTLKFDFDASCDIDPAKESHMHALVIRFDDADTITTSCVPMINGKKEQSHSVALKRTVQTSAR
jgi:hypothetical protein